MSALWLVSVDVWVCVGRYFCVVHVRVREYHTRAQSPTNTNISANTLHILRTQLHTRNYTRSPVHTQLYTYTPSPISPISPITPSTPIHPHLSYLQVATRRVKGNLKNDIPFVDEPLVKLDGIGRQTAEKLADMVTAGRKAGVRVELPHFMLENGVWVFWGGGLWLGCCCRVLCLVVVAVSNMCVVSVVVYLQSTPHSPPPSQPPTFPPTHNTSSSPSSSHHTPHHTNPVPHPITHT